MSRNEFHSVPVAGRNCRFDCGCPGKRAGAKESKV